MPDSSHWDRVYAGKEDDLLSWHQQRPDRSLSLIDGIRGGADTRLIDVGAGTSPLIPILLQRSNYELWWLDLSPEAAGRMRQQLAGDAERIHWVVGDVVQVDLPAACFDIWHDRAVFHFLVSSEARTAYVAKAARSLKPGGHVVIATFAEDGPTQCSGLPTARYDAASLAAEFGTSFELLHSEKEGHRTPTGNVQSFRYSVLRYVGP